MPDIKTMNKALLSASAHLFEAGKYLTNVEEFAGHASLLFKMADDLASIIQPEELKVTEDKMKDILNEIMNFGEANGKN